MLEITLTAREWFNDDTGEFITIPRQRLRLNHSLVSISKWESKWKKPFFSKEDKTPEQFRDYIECMSLTPNIRSEAYMSLTAENVDEITAYMKDSMTATWFAEEESKKGDKDVVTSELLYWMMTANQIPIECQRWHINRLLTLIRVCGIKNAPPDKKKKGMTSDAISKRATLNAARRKRHKSKG